MHKYLYRFLTSPDATFQHIAVWTIVQLLESGGMYHHYHWSLSSYLRWIADPQLISNIRSSNSLIPNIRQLAATRTSTPASSIGGTPRSHGSHHSYQDTETGEGQGEIQQLARRILEFTDGDVEGNTASSAPTSQKQAGSLIDSRAESMMGRDHEELRRSVREAFSSGQSGH